MIFRLFRWPIRIVGLLCIFLFLYVNVRLYDAPQCNSITGNPDLTSQLHFLRKGTNPWISPRQFGQGRYWFWPCGDGYRWGSFYCRYSCSPFTWRLAVSEGLCNGTEALLFPHSNGKEKRFLFGQLPVLDAFIAWTHANRCITDHSKPGHWRWKFQAISLLLISFLLWSIWKTWKARH